MTRTPLRLIAALPVLALVLAGCGSDSDDTKADADKDAGSGAISIVASTNVYGDIAEVIAGDHAEVTSIITSSAQDPHEYEASAQDRLAFDDADVVIKNGGGYDSFVDTLLEASSSDPIVLDAVEISGLAPDEHDGGDHAHEDDDEHAHEDDDEHAHEDSEDEHGHEGHDHIEGFNEHVWYHFPTVEKVAEELSHELSELDPDNAATYQANYEAFAEQIAGLISSAEAIKATGEGRGAAITEPVPLYLLEAVGLVNHTTDEFSEAVEEGADVPPRVLQETLDMFTTEEIAVLAYNSQTADSTTEAVRAAAEAAEVPVVDFTETLPEGQSYVAWQQENLDNLAEALG
ncbi:MAG: zinc ABC transporter substrate-binding protein [Nocardioidaceae bacterium]|nr:MAG: zinc ABC transporter substrate-binding protein [Nocardioidaceae bacterium]